MRAMCIIVPKTLKYQIERFVTAPSDYTETGLVNSWEVFLNDKKKTWTITSNNNSNLHDTTLLDKLTFLCVGGVVAGLDT